MLSAVRFQLPLVLLLLLLGLLLSVSAVPIRLGPGDRQLGAGEDLLMRLAALKRLLQRAPERRIADLPRVEVFGEGAVDALTPIVFVPGLEGQQLEYTIDTDRSTVPNVLCAIHQKKWTILWLQLSIMVPIYDQCFFHAFNPRLDMATMTWSNADGVDMRVFEYGDINSVAFFHIGLKEIPVYNQFIDIAYARGYSNETLRVSQYDFRYAPTQLRDQGWFNHTKAMVEDVAASTGQKVNILSQSFGGPLVHRFLYEMDQAWKDKYVRLYIDMCGPHFGSPLALMGQLSGLGAAEVLNNVGVDAKLLRSFIRASPSITWLLPAAEAFPEIVLTFGSTTKYPISNYSALFNAVGLVQTAAAAAYLAPERHSIGEAINVTTVCVHGEGIPTVNAFDYKSTMVNDTEYPGTFFPQADGDGVVPIVSLNACKNWGTETWKSYDVPITNLTHGAGLSYPPIINMVLNMTSPSV